MDCLIGWMMDRPAGWLTCWLSDWLNGGLTSWLTEWWTSRLKCYLTRIDCIDGWYTDHCRLVTSSINTQYWTKDEQRFWTLLSNRWDLMVDLLKGFIHYLFRGLIPPSNSLHKVTTSQAYWKMYLISLLLAGVVHNVGEVPKILWRRDHDYIWSVQRHVERF